MAPIIKKQINNKRFRAIASEELDKSIQTKIEPIPELSGAPGWGKPETEFSTVNFKLAIARSHLLLERAATYRDPSLSRHPTQSVRDYVFFLRERCADLNFKPWKSYIEGYERARFGPDEFTQQEYTEFMKHFLTILTYFENS
eukprot:GEZU01021376.1.p1 GENE.GEZU01021376.1~~GEZU01021376.1.p1  ORF type:complete len:143 (+),score=31.97 GEZU01021376.1:371-799(+)